MVNAATLFGDFSLGRYAEYWGEVRCPAAGRSVSAADDRMVSEILPLRTTKFPMNVAPACRRIVSPAAALSRAAWRFPPAATVIVAAAAGRDTASVKVRAVRNPTRLHAHVFVLHAVADTPRP